MNAAARWAALVALASLLFVASSHNTGTDRRPDEASTRFQAIGQPLHFEANQGQADSQVRFLSRGNGFAVLLGSNRAVLRLYDPTASTNRGAGQSLVAARDMTVSMALVGANPDPTSVGLMPQSGHSNYFVGKDPAGWHTGIPHYGRVHFTEVYPGVDLVYYGTSQRQLEYDFVVSPG
ncbi:MAG: hypothetical protein JRG95_25385, partial [Deltaproteobacteria bacterium]|nr:hypothetical protein [Deltaproteobacteria bacterium]